MRALFAVSASLCLGGCTLGNLASIHRSVDMTGGQTQIVDAEQRLVIAYPTTTTVSSGNTKSTTKGSICAEPSPDTFSVIAASGELSVATAKVDASGSAALSETGASLIDRTASLQALRDAYFRLCESRANGWSDDTDLMIGQRHNQTALVGLMAIDGLTRAARPATIIGGEASATSASAVAAIARQLKAHREANTKIEAEQAAIKARTGEIDKAIAALNAENPAPSDKDAQLKTLNDEKTALGAREKDLAAEKKTNDEAIAALSRSLDSIATGSSAGSVTPVQITLPGAQSDMTRVADAVVQIVRAIDDNDFGPSICLHRLARLGMNEAANGRRTELKDSERTLTVSEGFAPGVSEHCDGVLDAYVSFLKARVMQMHAKSYIATERAKAIMKSDATPAEKANQLAEVDAEYRSNVGLDLGLFGGNDLVVPAPTISLPGN